MPRAPRPTPTGFLPSAPPGPPIVSPIVARLRQTWQFAAISQFLFTFEEAFGMSGFDIQALERDFDGTETRVIPDLMVKLLYTLTFDKSISLDNWQEHLRRQWIARDAANNKMGDEDAPRTWAELALTDKVMAIYNLCEWQLHDAERFKGLVNSKDDEQAWRIDPVGWDAQGNTYWLFDDNRLWIEQPRPRPPATPKSKKGRAAAKGKEAKGTAKAKTLASTTPRRLSNARAAKKESTPKNASSTSMSNEGTRSSSRMSRKRPRESEATPRITRSAQQPASPSSNKRPRVLGTRVSSRLRGRDSDDDVWQEVPPEWLGQNGEAQGSKTKQEESATSSALSSAPPSVDGETAREKQEGMSGRSSDDSELSDPPEDVDGDMPDPDEKEEEGEEVEMEEEIEEIKEETPTKEEEGWIEWEAICVTIQDWEAFAQRFAKSKHPDEKALHEHINKHVLEKVLNDLREAERKRKLEEALQNRKRSSRLAIKESEREEQRRQEAARAEMEERMERVRREEERRRREEEERVAKEEERERRARERELRLLQREEAAQAALIKAKEEEERARAGREERSARRAAGYAVSETASPQPKSPRSESEATDAEAWTLACEICRQSGTYVEDDGSHGQITCCEKCGVWQHCACWDRYDWHHGRPPRDWATVDFFCTGCWPKPAVPASAGQAPPSQPIPSQPQQQPRPPAPTNGASPVTAPTPAQRPPAPTLARPVQAGPVPPRPPHAQAKAPVSTPAGPPQARNPPQHLVRALAQLPPAVLEQLAKQPSLLTGAGAGGSAAALTTLLRQAGIALPPVAPGITSVPMSTQTAPPFSSTRPVASVTTSTATTASPSAPVGLTQPRPTAVPPMHMQHTSARPSVPPAKGTNLSTSTMARPPSSLPSSSAGRMPFSAPSHPPAPQPQAATVTSARMPLPSTSARMPLPSKSPASVAPTVPASTDGRAGLNVQPPSQISSTPVSSQPTSFLPPTAATGSGAGSSSTLPASASFPAPATAVPEPRVGLSSQSSQASGSNGSTPHPLAPPPPTSTQ